MNQGQEVYQSVCVACHGPNDEGTAGPALAGNEALQDEVHVLRQIIYGGGAMPAFGQQLTDEEVATVATFIRTERLGEQFRSCTCGGGSTAALARQAGSK